MTEPLITKHLDLWTSAIEAKSTAGRGSNNRFDLYGIKKLRDLILELAIRGKLVPQDPTDEPSKNLITEIATKRLYAIANKTYKNITNLPPLDDEDLPISLPNGWSVDRLGNILRVINGRAYKQNEMLNSGTPLLRVGNLFTSDEWFYSDLELDDDKYIDNGDLIYAWSASFGPFIWGGDKVIYHYHIWKLEEFLKGAMSKEFLYVYLKAITEDIKASGNGIAMIHMTKERMERLIIPIPPLNEQRRIVAKINELMTLCDQLEQQTLTSMEAHTILVETLLSTLTASADADELAQNWNRISEHFDTLFTTEQSIDLLKQTILQLAVMGKLVPQVPTDEPASVLLEKIAAEKAQLIKDKKIKKEKPLPPISDDEKPFELPQGWEWCRLGSLNIEFQNGASSRGDTSGREITVVRLADIKNGFINLDEPRALLINENSIDRYSLCNGDMLIIRVNGSADIVGRFILSDKDYDAIYCDHFIRMRRVGAELFDSNFLKMISESKFLRGKINDLFITTAGQKTVNQTHISSLVLAFPPLNEQKKITEKAEVLLNICQRLKNNVQKANQIQLYITDSIVDGSLSEV